MVKILEFRLRGPSLSGGNIALHSIPTVMELTAFLPSVPHLAHLSDVEPR
jgi:hypothetical protein